MRYENMSSFIVMDIVKKAQEYENVIHFEIGQPDLLPNEKVKEKLHEAVNNNEFAYTESLGLKALRIKIKKHYKKTYNVNIHEDQVLLTPGTSGAFLIAYTLCLKYDNNLGLSDPSYPCYKNFAHMLDINPIFMKIDKTSNYELTKEHLKNKNLNALQISSPCNPIGNVYDKKNLEELITYCKNNNIAFISDELYHGLSYEEEAHSALEFDEDAFVINGFSKYYCMPGLRLGWIIVPKKHLRQAEIIAQNIFISAPTLSQHAALEAFDYEYLNKQKEIFKQRRDYLYKELKEIFEIDVKPQGAFYIWVNVSKYTKDSFIFANELLENIQIAVTPGLDFGHNDSNLYLRFAYTRDLQHLKEGVKRLKEYLNNKELT